MESEVIGFILCGWAIGSAAGLLFILFAELVWKRTIRNQDQEPEKSFEIP